MKDLPIANVFYLHWHEAEANDRVRELQSAGHAVRCHWSTEEPAKLGEELPEAVVISLDRLPSHGRSFAEWFWEAKKRQGIALIFAGGKPDKVAVARKQFPKAVFCSGDEVVNALSRLATQAC